MSALPRMQPDAATTSGQYSFIYDQPDSIFGLTNNTQPAGDKFNISNNELPSLDKKLVLKINEYPGALFPPNIEDKCIDNANWRQLYRDSRADRNNNQQQQQISLTVELIISTLFDQFKRSIMCDNLPCIPTVNDNSNQQVIEWVKIVRIESPKLYIGVSLKYVFEEHDNKLIHAYCIVHAMNISEIIEIIGNFYQRELVASGIGLSKDYITQKRLTLDADKLDLYRPWGQHLVFTEGDDDDMDLSDDDDLFGFELPPW